MQKIKRGIWFQEIEENGERMKEVKSCGFILFRINPDTKKDEFLLMKHAKYETSRFYFIFKHPSRYDLPKGHREQGETDIETALRELKEETGFSAEDLQIDPTFQFTEVYYPTYKRFGKEKVKKTLVIFFGRLKAELEKGVQLTEHSAFCWISWSPPHKIQANTIDPLLSKLSTYLAQEGETLQVKT